MLYIIDETGARHSHCHGVSAAQWYETIIEAIAYLSKPARRAEMGLAKLGEESLARCDDPDCNRLNRLPTISRPKIARYVIVREIAIVRPVTDGDRDREICLGHPHSSGQYICENCARVATAKRLIDREREEALVGRR